MQDVLPMLEVDELESEADTVGGFLMERLSRVPSVGDTVEIPGWILRVRSMDRLRIGRVEAIINPVMDTT
jgi:CBS domain containing-hemolysin-like protein